MSGDGQEETVQILLDYNAFFKEITVLQYAAGVGRRHERVLAPFARMGRKNFLWDSVHRKILYLLVSLLL